MSKINGSILSEDGMILTLFYRMNIFVYIGSAGANIGQRPKCILHSVGTERFRFNFV